MTDYWAERVRPQEGATVEESKVNGARFNGIRQEFINARGNRVRVLKNHDGTNVEIYEFAPATSTPQIALMGVYELPADHPWREDGRFLLVEKQCRINGGGFKDQLLDEYAVRVYYCDKGGVFEVIYGITGAELRYIVTEHLKIWGTALCLSLHARHFVRTGDYRIYRQTHHDTIENSAGGPYTVSVNSGAEKELV